MNLLSISLVPAHSRRNRISPRFFARLAGLCLMAMKCLADDDAAKVDAFVRGEMEKQKIPGLALLVNTNGTEALVRCYGMANMELQAPVKRETVFQSGSVGKQFTATAVMMLVEEGKIGLDDPLKKYLPTAPAAWDEMRVRHLLTHTSGFGDYPADFNFRRDYSEDELLAILSKAPLASVPGEKFSYSNVGYVTLGVLIGKVTGRFYGDFLTNRIFKPLEMSTARIINEADIVMNRAAGYRLVNGVLKNQEWVSPSMNSTADGSLYFTISDMAKWDAALYTEKLLKKRSLDLMWTPAAVKDAKQSYGFGWFVNAINGHRLIHHGGAWQGFQCGIQRYVDDKLTVVAFDNLAGSNLEKIIRGVASIYLPDVTPDWMKAAH